MEIKKIIILLILCVFIPSCNFEKKPEEKQPIFDAQEQVNAWVSMWNDYNLSMVDKLFLTDDRITYFSSEKEGLIKGIEAVREHHTGFGFIEGGKIQDNKLWVEDLQANVYGSTAVATGIWYFRRGPEDSKDISRGPVTFVYVQEDGEYRLAHLHFSEYEE
jgi:ketosteroid isomerase-like protein